MSLMVKQLTEELRVGLAALNDLPGIVIAGNPAWNPEAQRWVIHCRIAIGAWQNSPVPAVSSWYVLVDDWYPHGRIGIYPAKDGGIAQTYPHQNYNGIGKEQYPWRAGKLCTWTDAAPLHRNGYDIEPGDPEQNLAWHLERAKRWLDLAARGELALPGERFELPDVPHRDATKFAFCESPYNLCRWQGSNRRYGTALTAPLESNPSIVTVVRFNTGQRQLPIEQEWRKDIGGSDKRLALWIRTDRIPVLPPWQMPATWGELRYACQLQDINLDKLLRPAISSGTGGDWPLLIGFPIPDKIGGPNLRMHWLALGLPVLSSQSLPGFRNNERGRWLAYKRRKIHDAAALCWLPTENWHYDEVSVRGRLSTDTAQSSILIIGAGAVGSALAELLARAGVRDMTVMDSDCVEAGNLVRHTLLSSDISRPKASTLRARLDAATLHGNVAGIDASFPPDDAETAGRIRNCAVVIDTTGNDAVAAAMGSFYWDGIKTFVSVSLGIHARRLFCFTARGPAFPRAAFGEQLQPWLQQESAEYDIADLPRDGPGCWHIRHPARIDDIWLLTAAAVRIVEQAIANPPDAPLLTVFQQHTDAAGNFAGIGVVSHDAMPR